MGTAEWFNTFCSTLLVRDGGTISKRYKMITRRLNRDFWNTDSETSHSLYVGSYGRNTAIDGFSDLDMVFRLPYSLFERYDQHVGNGQSSLLQAVRNSMRRTFSNSKIGGDRQVVVVEFQDGLTFEVMPAFLNNDGSYTYADSKRGGAWKVTNPRPEVKAIRERNDVCNGNLVPLCRMMRAWKARWKVPMGGLLIDTLAYQFIAGWAHRDQSYLYYDWMCRDFFEFLKGQDRKQLFWKAPGSGQYVYKKGVFHSKAARCHNISLLAIQHESADHKREWSAKRKWRAIFGSRFPN